MLPQTSGGEFLVRQSATDADIDRQLPTGDEVFLDHVGHFVRDAAAAAEALARAGFAPTPRSVQVNRDDGALTGTGNVAVMLGRGYVEVLFKTADTPLGREFDGAVTQYPGIHLAAFAVADAGSAHGRLVAEGFRTRPLAEMQRPVDTECGPGTAAFTIARVEPGEMAEGRIQILTHRTEDTVWQQRWLTHPNGTAALAGLMIAVADVEEAGRRFARFTGRPATASRLGRTIRLDRGRLELVTTEAFAALLPDTAIPRLPFMGAYALVVRSLADAEAALRRGGVRARAIGAALAAPFPAELGVGAWLFAEKPSDFPWHEGG
jgi:Glyoxalase-like domain